MSEEPKFDWGARIRRGTLDNIELRPCPICKGEGLISPRNDLTKGKLNCTTCGGYGLMQTKDGGTPAIPSQILEVINSPANRMVSLLNGDFRVVGYNDVTCQWYLIKDSRLKDVEP